MPFTNEYIDKNTPIPLYYQLKEIILKKIKDGEINPGDLIPTEVEFNEIFNLSRTTIRQALTELVQDGYLYRVKGKGTFVAKPKIVQDFMQRIEPYSEQMKRLNMTPKTEVLTFSELKAPEDVETELGLKKGDKVVLLRRLRYANDEPIVVLDTYLPMQCSAILNEDMEKTGLYEFLSRKESTRIIRVVRQVEAVVAGEIEHKYLKIPVGYPIQLTTTIGYNENSQPIEYSIAHYRGDKNKFIIELKV